MLTIDASSITIILFLMMLVGFHGGITHMIDESGENPILVKENEMTFREGDGFG